MTLKICNANISFERERKIVWVVNTALVEISEREKTGTTGVHQSGHVAVLSSF